jgi:hypothetical protein
MRRYVDLRTAPNSDYSQGPPRNSVEKFHRRGAKIQSHKELAGNRSLPGEMALFIGAKVSAAMFHDVRKET